MKVISLTDFKSPHATLFIAVGKVASIQTMTDGTATVNLEGSIAHHVQQNPFEVMRRIRQEQL